MDQLLSALKQSDFIFDSSAVATAVETKMMFQMFDSVESLKLDMYPREMIPGELGRSVTTEIFEQVSIPIVSRVDAAVSKLVWISKGSHMSRRDLRQLMRNVSEEEGVQIRQMADNLGLTDLLQTVLLESDEIEV